MDTVQAEVDGNQGGELLPNRNQLVVVKVPQCLSERFSGPFPIEAKYHVQEIR